MGDCNCSDGDIQIEIPVSDCPFDLKQVQKFGFETFGKVIWDSADGGGLGDGVPQLDSQVDTLADWLARRAALVNTKIVISPFIGGDPILVAGEAITEGGGDNSTLSGVEEVTGTSPTLVSATFKSLTPEQESAMKAVACKNTGVYLFTEAGKIACRKIPGTTNHQGFPIQAYFFSDRDSQGFGQKDKHFMRFSLAKGWSENLVLVTPADFNPLYDL